MVAKFRFMCTLTILLTMYVSYMNNLCPNFSKIVLVAIEDSGATYMSPAIDALKRLGAVEPLQTDYRGSFAFAGYAGGSKPPWVAQQNASRARGPRELSLKIPLSEFRKCA